MAHDSLVPLLIGAGLAGWIVAAVVMVYATRLQRRYLDLREKRSG